MSLSHTANGLFVRRFQISPAALCSKFPPAIDIRFLWNLNLVAKTETIRATLHALWNALCGLGLTRHEVALKAHPVVIAGGHIRQKDGG
jgi:hypothetical protein